MRDRRPRVLLRAVTFGGIFAVNAVHLVQPLGPGVPGLEIVVAQRPGGRHAVRMLDLAEVPWAQPVQRSPVQLGGAADVVMHLRLERLAVSVEPRFRRHVPAVYENRAGIPVIGLAWQEVAPLQQQYPLARRG